MYSKEMIKFCKKTVELKELIRLTICAKQDGFRKNNEDVVELCAEVGNHYNKIYNKRLQKGNGNVNYIEDISI